MECVVPRMAIKELLRIKQAPTHISASKNSMTFHYADGCWLRTQLLALEWPNIDTIIERTETGAKCYPIDPELFNCLEKIKPFADKMGKVY
ncbi:hypothetical protein, partial [Enterobacter cloacae]|uniref:hypothetical protein n=1 Tax=Enterobacter cloacae TaxID=550 RepID=UPI0021CF850C